MCCVRFFSVCVSVLCFVVVVCTRVFCLCVTFRFAFLCLRSFVCLTCAGTELCCVSCVFAVVNLCVCLNGTCSVYLCWLFDVLGLLVSCCFPQ